jgi:serine phosphatase RsbU (regulator of sigma subunit)
MGSSLYVEVPGEPPFEVRLEKDLISVGRSEDNVLGLRDMNVSRVHFVIERRENTWLVRDKGSRNGTLVNRQPVYDKVLREGDRIEVGGTALTFRAQASRLAISMSDAPRPKPSQAPPSQPRDGTVADKPAPTPVPVPQAPPIGAFAARPTTYIPSPAPPASPAPTPPGPLPATQRVATTPFPIFTPPPTPAAALPRPNVGMAPGSTPAAAAPRAQAPIPPSQLPAARRDPLPELPATTPERTPLPERTVPIGTRNVGRVGDLVEKTPQPPRPARPARNDRWKKLAELTAAINQERDLGRLLERIVDAVLSLVPARGAFLVTLKDDQLDLRVARNFDARALGDPEGAYRLSYQTCREAIESKRPILTRDAQLESNLAGFDSISNLQLKAILCVPFGVGREMLGVVYLDEPQLDPGEQSTDVIELVAAFGDLAGIAFANARHLEEVARRERLSEELKIASRIQRKLLPETAPRVPGLEIAGRTIPAEEVGGDLYDFFLGPTGDLFISCGDVSGKGAGAGIVMASARALLRAYAERESRTDRLLAALNNALVRDLEKGSFVSIVLLRYSPTTQKVAFAGGGHEHLLVCRPRTGNVERIRSGGVVLGLSADVSGKLEERPLDLAPGDQVVLYTDGATEAASPEGEELGLDRLAAIVGIAREKTPADMVAHVVEHVRRFTGEGYPLRDDLTVVALKRV